MKSQCSLPSGRLGTLLLVWVLTTGPGLAEGRPAASAPQATEVERLREEVAQLITQYSYLTRSPWAAPPGTPGRARTQMVYADLRYVLP